MSLNPLFPLANHLWQSTLFAVAAGALTLAFGKNRARVRQWIWFTASCKFLMPFSLLIALGSAIHWRTAPPGMEPAVAAAVGDVSQPFPEAAPARVVYSGPRPPEPAVSLVSALTAAWLCGFLGITGSWWIRWRRMRAIARAASPLTIELPVPARSSPQSMEPCVFGILRPMLLLPEGIRSCLTAEQLDAVIEHELCHVRHRDNLTAAIHMFVETAFWFHPLVWWMERRMAQERERACDEEVLRRGGAPRVYAESILEVCKLYTESRLAFAAAVTGGDLKRRIAAIMRRRPAASLSRSKKLTLSLAAASAVGIPVGIGLLHAPFVWGQSGGTPKPRFEVASVKPCDPHANRTTFAGTYSRGGVALNCSNLETFVRHAYAVFASGRVDQRGQLVKIEGGPQWVRRELYSINAKAPVGADPASISGAMMQSLLEERFQLKVHRETRQVPVYALEVMKSGVKLPHAKIRCFEPGSGPWPPKPGETPPPTCGYGKQTKDGVEVLGATMADFALAITTKIPLLLEPRLLIDRTGIKGNFDFDLSWSGDLEQPEPGAPRAFDPNRDYPRLDEALRRVGLQLVLTKGPGEFLIIDHAERPSPN